MSTDPTTPTGYEQLNRYTRIIVDEALRRGVAVEVADPARGELVLSFGARRVTTFESLSELTSAVAYLRCTDKVLTRRVLAGAGLPVPRGREATGDDADRSFLAECGEVVVKPVEGEGGQGITVGVTEPDGLVAAVARAAAVHPRVLLEACHRGEDLRVLVIADEVVAAAVRRPPVVVGDGTSTVRQLVAELSARRAEETDGAASIPFDAVTEEVVAAAGHAPDSVLDHGVELAVRRTANVHTGGTITDVTDRIHPALGTLALDVARAIDIPVVGVDLVVPDLEGPDAVVIEANEQPGLANHEPRPTAERFVDLLVPASVTGRRR